MADGTCSQYLPQKRRYCRFACLPGQRCCGHHLPREARPQPGRQHVQSVAANAPAAEAAAECAPSEEAAAFAPPPLSAEVRASLLAIYGADELATLEASLATPCAALHLRCNTLRCTRAELLAELRGREELAGFAIEPHGALDDVAVILRKPPAAALAPHLELECRVRGCVAAERFAARRRAGLPLHEVFVDQLCAEAVLKGAHVFVRGVRGASLGLDAGAAVSVYADAAGALLRGAQAECPLDATRFPFLGVGTCCLERGELFRRECGLGVMMRHVVAGDLPALSGVLPDKLYVQSLPSLVVAHVLGARPGERVLDLCAAPGSKASHVASNFLRDAAPPTLLVACERHHAKVEKMAELLRSFAPSCAKPVRIDSARLGGAEGSGGELPDGELLEPRSFDRVLLDPPCSGLGLRPKLAQSASATSLAQAPRFQRGLLWSAVRMLRVGGTLVYSTCTLTHEEDEGMVAHALRAYPCLELIPA